MIQLPEGHQTGYTIQPEYEMSDQFFRKLSNRLDRADSTNFSTQRMSDWTEEILGDHLWSGQRIIMDSIDDNRYTAVASCHGIGKTYTVARAVLAFLHTRRDSVVITTAPTNFQVKNVMWKYIRGAALANQDKLLGNSLMMEYNITPEWYAIGFKPDSAETDRFQGFHSKSGNILTVIDEAAGVPDEVMDVLRATMVSDGGRYIMIGNPTSLSGRFREAFEGKRDSWNTIVIPAKETPNFTGEGYYPGLITPSFAEEEIAEHGIDSDYVKARIFAQFPDGVADTLIPMPWIEAATQRSLDEVPGAEEQVELGIDVARFGGDEFAIYARQGGRVLAPCETWTKHDLEYSAGRVKEYAQRFIDKHPTKDKKSVYIKIDETGLGAGIADFLKGDGYNVEKVNFGAGSSDPAQWLNLRNEMWWNLREWFRTGTIAARGVKSNEKVKTGYIDSKTMGQLSDVMYTYDRKHTKPVVESKDEAKKRRSGKQSPDRAEALMLAFFRPAGAPTRGTRPMVGSVTRKPGHGRTRR